MKLEAIFKVAISETTFLADIKAILGRYDKFHRSFQGKNAIL